MVLAIVGAYGNNSVGGAYVYLYNLTAGVGLVMILRWYWWRVNAWSEISALCASALVSNLLLLFNVFKDANATRRSAARDRARHDARLDRASRCSRRPSRKRRSSASTNACVRARSGGSAWRGSRGRPRARSRSASNIIDWFAGCGLVYGALFGIGKLVLGNAALGGAYLAFAAACGAIIAINVMRTERASARAARAATLTAG